jgi:hypothetical protein
MNRVPNAQLNLASPDSLSVRVATRVRRRMFSDFMAFFMPTAEASVLDVGVTSDTNYASSNYFEEWYPWKDRITALGLDDAKFLEVRYPGVHFVRANALEMPFGDAKFDYVHSAAVFEHVGSATNQRRLITECARVARYGICITTPNRRYPVEFHTQLPLLHLLPRELYRALYRMLGYGFFADEVNLNLVSPPEMRSLADGIPNWRFTLRFQRLLGLRSNILLFGERISGAS